MDFKQATDAICDAPDHKAVSQALGVSVQAVRQARMSDGVAKREPPKEWRYALIRLAEQQIMHYRKLIEQLRKEEI